MEERLTLLFSKRKRTEDTHSLAGLRAAVGSERTKGDEEGERRAGISIRFLFSLLSCVSSSSSSLSLSLLCVCTRFRPLRQGQNTMPLSFASRLCERASCCRSVSVFVCVTLLSSFWFQHCRYILATGPGGDAQCYCHYYCHECCECHY